MALFLSKPLHEAFKAALANQTLGGYVDEPLDHQAELRRLELETAKQRRRAAYFDALASKQSCRPSLVLCPNVTRPGTTLGLWLCEYSGVQGWGDSPDEACAEFDKVWQGLGS